MLFKRKVFLFLSALSNHPTSEHQCITQPFNSQTNSHANSPFNERLSLHIINENRKQNVISYNQLGVYQQKGLRMGFEHMAAPTKDGLWIGWCGLGFESHSQPFLLTYPGLIKACEFCLLFPFIHAALQCL